MDSDVIWMKFYISLTGKDRGISLNLESRHSSRSLACDGVPLHDA